MLSCVEHENYFITLNSDFAKIKILLIRILRLNYGLCGAVSGSLSVSKVIFGGFYFDAGLSSEK